MKIKKGDKVHIIAGKNNGKEGLVEKVYNRQNKILILGVNLYKKHVRKNEKMPQGGVVEVPRPLDVSKVIFICPKCKGKTRLGYVVEKNKKSRICKKCKSIV